MVILQLTEKRDLKCTWNAVLIAALGIFCMSCIWYQDLINEMLFNKAHALSFLLA